MTKQTNGGMMNCRSQDASLIHLESELNEFKDSFKYILEDVREESFQFKVPKYFEEYLKKMFEYTVMGGKMTRGCLVVITHKYLNRTKILEENVLKARRLGWCVEILQGLFLVLDDIMDASHTRRGKPCWYKLVCRTI